MTSSRNRVTIGNLRVASQIFFFLVAVLGIFGIAMTGFIYPFFFCPASPGACAGCPIWVIEHGTLNIVKGIHEGISMLVYLVGLFLVIGVLVGRSFCGWACPVGTLQDLFSYLDRKLNRDRRIFLLAGISFGMLILGSMFPYMMRKAGQDLLTYMWAGYIGALGVFLSALAGVIFIKRKKSIIPSLALLGIGVMFWVVNIATRALGWEGYPISSVELMGLLALMFGSIGLIGIVRLYLGERFPRINKGGKTGRRLRWTKYVILISIAPTTWLFDSLFFTDFCPIGGITATLPELLLNPTGWSGNEFFWYKAVFVVGVIAFVSFIDRGWCKYLCPVGAMYAPMNKISITDIQYDPEECIHCQLCITACPMGINPKEDKRDPECIRCGRCVSVCPTTAQRFVLVNRSIRRLLGK